MIIITVIIYCRDNLYRLTLNSLTPLEHASWPAPPEKATVCQDKGQTAQDCHNYIKVLLTNGKSLFTCGTNAFSPQCTWREVIIIINCFNSQLISSSLRLFYFFFSTLLALVDVIKIVIYIIQTFKY